MKKIFLITLLMLCNGVFAQEDFTKKSKDSSLKFGIKVGLNISYLTEINEPSNEVTPRVGINIGGYLRYKINDVLTFQPELLYSTQGMHDKYYNDNLNIVRISYRLDYLAAPLMIKYYPNPSLSLEFGPQISYLVSKKIEAELNNVSLVLDPEDFFNNEAKTNLFDLGFNLGLGYELKNGINFNGRYSLGMINIFKGQGVEDYYGSSIDVKNSVFSFGLGYTFK